MLKVRRALVVILVAVLFGLGIFCGLKLPSIGSGSAPRTYDTPALLKQVQTLSELVTVRYVMEKVVVWEVPPENLLGQMFAGDNRILLLAHGIVKAGIDFDKIKPEDLQVQGKTITIKLPNSRITDAYLDDRQTKVIERTTGFLRSFDKDLEQTTRQYAVDDIQRAARLNGILKDAEERARLQLTNLFYQLGFEKVEIE
jgi:hypothetical protein